MSDIVEHTFTSDQTLALDTVSDWLQSQNTGGTRRYLTMGGLAGTGKTTVVAEIARRHPELRTRWCAYTRKAAGVLRGKLFAAGVNVVRTGHDSRGRATHIELVSTVHGLIKKPMELWTCTTSSMSMNLDSDGELVDPICRSPRCRKRNTACHYRSDVVYGDRSRADLGAVDLIVVDEVSMLGRSLWKDLLAFGIPVLAVGDHGQLPPVRDDAVPLLQQPDIRLEKIHRQAEESGIIQIARQARETGRISCGVRPEPIGYAAKFSPNDGVPEIVFGDDLMMLTGRRLTRTGWNDAIRQARGFTELLPMVGERVVCLRNTQGDAYNGMLASVTRCSVESDTLLRMSLNPDDTASNTIHTAALRAQFGRSDPLTSADALRMGHPRSSEYQLWDWAYALTVHKAQGSEWDRVIVIEERLPGSDEKHARWLYTAVTRARHKLLVIGT